MAVVKRITVERQISLFDLPAGEAQAAPIPVAAAAAGVRGTAPADGAGATRAAGATASAARSSGATRAGGTRAARAGGTRAGRVGGTRAARARVAERAAAGRAAVRRPDGGKSGVESAADAGDTAPVASAPETTGAVSPASAAL